MKNADAENQSLLRGKMLAKLILAALIGISVSSLSHGSTLKCYTCNSDDDAGCFENPENQRIEECGHVIADLSSTRFRCMTIKGVNGNEKIAVRRCAVNDECNFQLRSDKSFEWGPKIFPDASCDECNSDLCNKN
ncbi:uncharacterized protein LOC129797372 [Lutzomyia longipalpis]|uniref:uncharacterized protein LOC129797372 n=1 Tax=Lutzomyia longipalpis TaxID=7200 RepID=UPI00248402D8|nr:uncharacterized protein LOC129797372 [Lutzomyia longipalpis]